MAKTEEEIRLEEDQKREKNWKRWGPYLSEREWATVREDYSPYGTAWEYFPHKNARSQAYRWGEDGLLGITDRECRLCFALALWNEKDPILKERLFGLTETEGNHGEDVKEYYFYLDSSPTHSYFKGLYKYPQGEFPYQKLVSENRKRTLQDREYELVDTGIFDGNNYFDVFAEYAKNSPNDILIKITVHNHSQEEKTLHLLPQLWFRNTWHWEDLPPPRIEELNEKLLKASHETLGTFFLALEVSAEEILFTENETNKKRLYKSENDVPYVKDAFHDAVVKGKQERVNPEKKGTKAAPHYVLRLKGGEKKVLKFRLFSDEEKSGEPFSNFESVFQKRVEETNRFYEKVIPQDLSSEEKMISRQAFAGLLWSKQFYHYIVERWEEGDPTEPPPPKSRESGRNSDWRHVYARDIISMPDKWEYPWFAAWDLAFHMIPFCKIDPDFAKKQMILFLREWYMHPNGQQPAYEFSFSDVNPPVHAWASWRIYKMTGKKGERDRAFLESVFQKLLFNFTWWLNRKDIEGHNLFSGGFLGLDNIGVFNRSNFSTEMILEQADATAWMAFYCLSMLSMALELAITNNVYEDIASKFFEHFIRITDSMNECGGFGLWDPTDGFYYDLLKIQGEHIPLRTRSLVGLIPLIAVEVLEDEKINALPGFKKRMDWFLNHRKDLERQITYCKVKEEHRHRLLAIPSKERLLKILKYLIDEEEFFSPHGIRSLSKVHGKTPYHVNLSGQEHSIEYVPGESNSFLFGGNSNWRGPVWFPINFLLIEALERYHHFYGDEILVEFPKNSGRQVNLKTIADEISNRLTSLFIKDQNGSRPCHGGDSRFASDPHWKDYLLFYEYFHGEDGRGLGASHQTGWTALIAKILLDKGNRG